jgi:replicative DNA helicase
MTIPQMPANLDIERELLSIMLNHPVVVPHVRKKVHATMLYITENQRLFKCMLYLYSNVAEKFDPMMVIETMDKLYGEDGSVAVAEILRGGMNEDRIDWFIDRILEYASRRKLIRMSQTTQKNANDMSKDLREIIQSIDSGVNLIRNAVKEEVDLKEDIEEMSLHIGNKDATIPFGVNVLDRKISGFMRNDITTIGGRTSHGKTTFAIDTMKRQLDTGFTVLVLTNEITKRLYLQKMACNIANIEYQKVIKYGDISDEEKEQFDKAKEHMLNNYVGKLHMYEFIDNIYAVTALINSYKPDVFWFDWLQRIPMVPGVTDGKEWIKIVYAELAKCLPKTNTAAVIVSQLSTRKAQARGNKRPELYDFDESSFIEKASCDCHLLYWYYNDTLIKDYMSIAELINAKNRFGEPSYSFLSHDARTGKYFDTSMIDRSKLNDYLKETGLSHNARS